MSGSTGTSKQQEVESQSIIQQNEAPIIEPPTTEPEGEEELAPNLLDYFASDKGHQVLISALEKYANHQLSGQSATADFQKTQLITQTKNWRLLMATRVFIFVIALGTAGTMAWHSKLDGAMGTLIGTLVGYFLGRSDKS